MALLQDLSAGPVRSLSFSKVRPTRPAVSASGEADFFAAPDFVMGSTTGNIVAVRSSNFEQPDGEPSHRLLVQVPASIPGCTLHLESKEAPVSTSYL